MQQLLCENLISYTNRLITLAKSSSIELKHKVALWGKANFHSLSKELYLCMLFIGFNFLPGNKSF